VSDDVTTVADTPPKIFISYRWSSPEHEEWVLRLATSLRDSGVDAQLDRWHLSEGQDTLAFMEAMVSDADVKKVLLICDAGYVQRANSREGGVGTEAQIISAKVYQDAGQDKFAAIVVELDELGKPLLPVYMSTRLYFDMSSTDAEAINFEKVVRWIFGEPFHALPPIGNKPDFLGKTFVTGSPLFRIGGSSASSTIKQALNDDAANILSSIADESESFLQTLVGKDDAAEQVYKGIKELRPVSENLYRAIRKIVSDSSPKSIDIVHSFFERLLVRWDYHPINIQYSRWDNDVYQYFTHDAFVSFVAISMELKDFSFAADLLDMPFFKPKAHDKTGEAVDYTAFRPYLESLDKQNSSFAQRRLSLHADLLHEAHEHSVVGLTAFMEADITLYLRGLLEPKFSWYPVSALYLTRTYGALPTYVRAQSSKVYERLKPLLLNAEAISVRQILSQMESERKFLRFDYQELNMNQLLAAENLATSA
jgi:TIR domain